MIIGELFKLTFFLLSLIIILMEKIKLISHNTLQGLNGIKTACLYFDQVEIPSYRKLFIKGNVIPISNKIDNPVLISKTYFTENSFEEQLEPLIRSGLVKTYIEFLSEHEVKSSMVNGLIESDLLISEDANLAKSVVNNFHYIFKMKEREFEGKGDWGVPNNFTKEVPGFIKSIKHNRSVEAVKYYLQLLNMILKNIGNGEHCLTTSNALNRILQDYFNSNEFKVTHRNLSKEINVNPELAYEAIKLSIPNVGKLSFEEVIDLRTGLKDELSAFRVYMKNLQMELSSSYDDKFISLKAKDVVETKINPSLTDLSRKLQGLKIDIPLKLLKEIKDPKSYSPLILSFSNTISSYYSILISMGLMSMSTAIDYYNSRKEIKNNSLYYLLKLKEK